MTKLRFRVLSLILSVITVFTSCSAPAGITDSQNITGHRNVSAIGLSDGDSKDFNEFLMDMFDEQVTNDSITFHYTLQHPENYGVSMDEITLGDFSMDEIDEDLKDTKNKLNQLQEFDQGDLSESQKLIYEMLEDALLDSVNSYDYALYQKVLSPTIGIQAQLPIVMNEYTFYEKQDIEDYIALLKDLNNYFEDILEFEKEKSKAGFFMADYTVDAIVAQCEEFIAAPEENLLIEIFNDKLTEEMPDLTDTEKQYYAQLNHDAVINHVIPAYKSLITGLNALKGTGTNDGGLANYDNGKEYYSQLAKDATGSSKTVNEMIALTNKALKQDLTLISLIYSKDNNIFTDMNDTVPNVTGSEAILTSLETNITNEFPAPVSSEFKIKSVHKSLEENASPAFYMIPAIDAQNANTIYINNYYMASQDPMYLFATLAHEGYPGHLYQTTYFNSTNPHPIRKILNYKGYAEGWATYVEMLSYSWSGATANVAMALKANQDFSYGICARVDMGVNYEGWTREQTKEFLENFNLGSDASVNNLYETVVAEPANYLSYYIGAKEFEELRESAQQRLGDNFDPVSFHKFILELGPAPFKFIENRLNIWIRDLKQSQSVVEN